MSAPLTPVSSSSIAAVGYDAESSTLTVRFTNGSTYEYAGVPAEVHAELLQQPSIGKYFHKAVRNGGFNHTRIDT